MSEHGMSIESTDREDRDSEERDRELAAVSMRNITKRFGDVYAVDDIDLDIADGEFFALLGPSGCGKTTTLRMIAGLEFPTLGSLRIYGNEVGTLAPNKRPVNTVFQNYALFPHMTVLENVGFGLKMQGASRAETKKQAMEAIEMVQLQGMEKRRPNQLSGGQQQRVALARALVNRPQVLLLDEPLGALDLKLRQEMQTELKSLQRELGITFVFVTHDQEEAMSMADRIAVMKDGILNQVASPEEIYERPANRFVADFIGHTNLLEGHVVDREVVRLSNGSDIPVKTDLPSGAKVEVSLRPERAFLHPASSTPEGAWVDGRVKSVTYLGNAYVYQVALDWMEIDVREENRPGLEVFDAGAPVRVAFAPDAVSVVTE